MLEFLYQAMSRLRSEEDGQTMVEYAVVIGLIVLAVALALSVDGVSTAINGVFQDVIDAL